MLRRGQSLAAFAEGVVEALGDLATGKAKEMLKKLAQHDADPYIRKIAGEAVVELES